MKSTLVYSSIEVSTQKSNRGRWYNFITRWSRPSGDNGLHVKYFTWTGRTGKIVNSSSPTVAAGELRTIVFACKTGSSKGIVLFAGIPINMLIGSKITSGVRSKSCNCARVLLPTVARGLLRRWGCLPLAVLDVEKHVEAMLAQFQLLSGYWEALSNFIELARCKELKQGSPVSLQWRISGQLCIGQSSGPWKLAYFRRSAPVHQKKWPFLKNTIVPECPSTFAVVYRSSL